MDQSAEIRWLIPHAELAIVERSGHSPQVEEGEAFTRRLSTFLTTAEARSIHDEARPAR